MSGRKRTAADSSATDQLNQVSGSELDPFRPLHRKKSTDALPNQNMEKDGRGGSSHLNTQSGGPHGNDQVALVLSVLPGLNPQAVADALQDYYQGDVVNFIIDASSDNPPPHLAGFFRPL